MLGLRASLILAARRFRGGTRDGKSIFSSCYRQELSTMGLESWDPEDLDDHDVHEAESDGCCWCSSRDRNTAC